MEVCLDHIEDGGGDLQDGSLLVQIEPLSTSDWVNIRHSCRYLLINRPQLMEKCNCTAFLENTIAKINDAEKQTNFEVMEAKLHDLENSQSPNQERRLLKMMKDERQRIVGRVRQWRVECAEAEGVMVSKAEKEDSEDVVVNLAPSIGDKCVLRARTWTPGQQWTLDLKAQAWRSGDNERKSDEFLLYVRPMQRLETTHLLQKWSRFLANGDAMPRFAKDLEEKAVADDGFVWARVMVGLGKERRRGRPGAMTRLVEEFADEFAIDVQEVEDHIFQYGILKKKAYEEIDWLVASGDTQRLAKEAYMTTSMINGGLTRVPEFRLLCVAVSRAISMYFKSFVVTHPHLSPNGEGEIDYVMRHEWICQVTTDGEIESQTREIYPEEDGTRSKESKPPSMTVILPERINKFNRL